MRSAALAFSRARATPICSTASALSRKPAVSIKVTGQPPRSICNSIISRVVPAKGETIATSRRASALSKVDFPALGGPAMTMVTPSRSRSAARPAASSCFKPGKNGGENFSDTPAGRARHAFFLRKIDLGFEQRRRLQERGPPDRSLASEHALRLTKGGAALPFRFGVDEIGETFDLRQIHLAVDEARGG